MCWTPQAALCSLLQEGVQKDLSHAVWMLVLQWVKEEVVKRKTKTTGKKSLMLFIMLSGLFKMNSIYDNEPLNEAIFNRYIDSAWR